MQVGVETGTEMQVWVVTGQSNGFKVETLFQQEKGLDLKWVVTIHNIYIYILYLGPCQGPDPLYVTPIQKKCRKIAYFSQKPQILENLARPYI